MQTGTFRRFTAAPLEQERLMLDVVVVVGLMERVRDCRIGDEEAAIAEMAFRNKACISRLEAAIADLPQLALLAWIQSNWVKGRLQL